MKKILIASAIALTQTVAANAYTISALNWEGQEVVLYNQVVTEADLPLNLNINTFDKNLIKNCGGGTITLSVKAQQGDVPVNFVFSGPEQSPAKRWNYAPVTSFSINGIPLSAELSASTGWCPETLNITGNRS